MESGNDGGDAAVGGTLRLAVVPACLLAAEALYVWYCATVRHAEPSRETKEKLHASSFGDHSQLQPQPFRLAELGYDFSVNKAYSFVICPKELMQPQQPAPSNADLSFNQSHASSFYEMSELATNLNVSVAHMDSREEAEVYVADVHDGSFIVSFKCRVPGLHELSVTVNGHHVDDSPRLILLQP